MELELKTCRCGCGKTWRAMAESRTQYYSQRHDPDYKPRLFDDYGYVKRIRKWLKEIYGEAEEEKVED